ncbi:cytochrome c peroxidase [Winogradskyella thalassocola]|uniref:Cytochrome c peroxidase n=1 Tax=Winogradskyella thalassocola TaxID=262004 RepID=A0A1G8G578_9FLAO|nr:hypothetical protein [Winogradskyella thalassocola]SDH89529.1 cytochrome c peroxidase [Winogradskyella thalassocola]
MRFRVPRLRNIEFTAPYGSFGQFTTLEADNLDPTLKENYNRISLSEEEKTNLIVFMNTLSDAEFLGLNY